MKIADQTFGSDLARIYDSNVESTEELVGTLDKLYRLPLYSFEDTVSEELFRYCQRRSFFVNIIAFQGNKVFLRRSIGNRLGWELPGSAIKSTGQESPNNAVERILRRDISNVDLSELCPVARIERTYNWQDNTTTHVGLTYIGRVRSPSPEDIEKKEEIKGRFVSIDDKDELQRLPLLDRLLVGHCITLRASSRAFQNFGRVIASPAVDRELDSNRRISSFRHQIHDKVVSKLFGSSSKALRATLLDAVSDSDTVLDVACGDDLLPHLIATQGNFVVANDVTWAEVLRLGSQQDRAKKIVYTNHDARYLPYIKPFDTVVCKNVLHHMLEVDDAKNLFESLKASASKRILIVDPEKPSVGPARARIWNRYYMTWLKDQGDHFLSQPEFIQMINHGFPSSDFDKTFEILTTVKGRYMYAKIEHKKSKQICMPPSTSWKASSEKWIVFDLDGLLVDSEHHFADCVVKSLSEADVFVKHDDYIAADLQRGDSLLGRLEREGRTFNRSEVERRIHELYGERISEINLMSHARETLERLAPCYQIALFTSSRKSYVDALLDRFTLRGFFEIIVTREDVDAVKPSPEGLFKIARTMQIDPRSLIVIEDSARGVKAAKAAGAACVVVPNQMTNGEGFLDADIVVTSLKCITPNLLEACFERSRRH